MANRTPSASHVTIAAVVALVGVLSARGARAGDVCYRLPFDNPDLDDGWGSTCCGRTNPHRGVDFPQPIGKPIPAVADGVVYRAPWNGCLGNVVVVAHPDGMFSGYSHMNAASPLADGQRVSKGEIVGVVGNTGTCTTGPHLHLTMAPARDGYMTGTTVDPYAFIKAREVCGKAPLGALESATCEALTGWAQDPDAPAAAARVLLSFGGPSTDAKAFPLTVLADAARGDLCATLGSCNHGFSASLPPGLWDGVSRPVFAYALDDKGGPSAALGRKELACTGARLPSGVVRRKVQGAAWRFQAAEIASIPDGQLAALPVGPDLPASPSLVTSGGRFFVREYATVRPVPDAAVMATWRFVGGSAKAIGAKELEDLLPGAPWRDAPFLVKGSGAEVYLLDAPPPLWAERVADDFPAWTLVGAPFDVTFTLLNRGSLTWDDVVLAPTPRDAASGWCGPSWSSCTRAAPVASGVATGAQTTVRVRLAAPAVEGKATACFGLVRRTRWFSDPGALGPSDDAWCRTVDVRATPPVADGDLAGSCACASPGAPGTRAAQGAVASAALSLGLALLRRRTRADRSSRLD